MWIIGQNGATAVDFTAIDIQVTEQQNEQDSFLIYNVVVFSFGTAFNIATYQSENEARVIVGDILARLSKGDEFYDLRQREAKILRGN